MTFAQYLAERPARFDIEGAFVRLARIDERMSRATSFAELFGQLKERDASFSVALAAQNVWTGYQRKLETQPDA